MIKQILNFLIGRSIIPVVPDYKPDISVLIPAYNEEETIRDTIESVKEQSYPVQKIIVIDDCSIDKTSEIAESMGITVVRTLGNSGSKSKAQNYVLMNTDLVDTELFVTIDADTLLDKNAIKNIVPVMSNPEVFSACGFVIPQIIKTFWETARFGQYLYAIGLNKMAQNNIGVPLVSSGCFSIFNTILAKKLGGFPDNTMCEDMALTWKAYMEGYKIKMVPSAICYPKDPNTWKIYNGQVSRWQRGLLQCIGLYKTKLFKKKRLAVMTYWYILTGAMMPFLILYTIYAIVVGTASAPIVVTWLGIDLSLTFIYIMKGGIKHQGIKKSFIAWIFYWISMPIEGYLFVNAILNEWILRRKLVTWNKGH